MEIPQAIKEVLERLSDAPSYIVGGWVRDAYLGKRSLDVDIATAIQPHDLKTIFQDFAMNHNQYGISFEYEGYQFEITTMRREVFHKQARHPDAYHFVDDLKIDSNRRDFTMNALYMDRFGVLYDFHKGLDDLNQGVLRFIGNPHLRIQEDPVRALRMIRFASQYDWEIQGFPSSLEVEMAMQNLPRIMYRKDLEKCLLSEYFSHHTDTYASIFALLFDDLLLPHELTWNLHKLPERVDLRLAAFLHQGVEAAENGDLEACLLKYQYKKKDIRNICQWIVYNDLKIEATLSNFQKFIAHHGRKWVYDLVSLQEGLGVKDASKYRMILETIERNAFICSHQELDIEPSDLIKQGLARKQISGMMEILFEAVVDQKIENKKEALLLEVQKWLI